MLKNLLPCTKGYRLVALLSPLLIVGEVLLEVRIPFLMSTIIDNGVIGGAGTAFIIRTGLKMVGMAVLSLLCGAGAARFAAVAGMGFGANLRAAAFNKIQDFSFANIDRFSTPSLITRMSTDVNTIQMGFTMVIRICFRAPLMFSMAIYYAFSINAELSRVFLYVAPGLAAALIIMGSFAMPRFKRLLTRVDNLNSSVQETLIGIRVVKAFVRAKYEKHRFEISNNDLRDASVSAEKVLILSNPIMQIASYSCIVLVLWFGGGLVMRGDMQTGELSAFINYIGNILMSLMMVSMIFVMAVMSRASLTRIAQVLGEVPDISDSAADPELTVQNGDISMKNVCFKYSRDAGKNVVDNINLDIKSGETIGIVGGTGSAKTTLVSLIPRLYDATSGTVEVGNRPVADYTLRNLRESVSVVLQVNVLFSGTIEENLRWGNPQASQCELEQACKIAQAHDFIMSFPDGYQTDLGQGGVNLSGGQKQRLCIARALLKSPKILILDDSTSAVDTATDAKIREGFKSKLGDITTIIIAQRINSVEHADRIIVLDDGKINAVGTHEELLATNRIYSEVYRSQQEGGAA